MTSVADANGLAGDASPANLQLRVFTCPSQPIGTSGRTFSPTTATLIYGKSEAVLVDALYMKDDVKALGDLIERTGKRLTTIFITHGHGDHYFGSDELVRRFPGVKTVATHDVVEYMKSTQSSDVKWFQALFADSTMVTPSSIPEALMGDVIMLEGNQLRVVPIRQGDIHPTTVLHVPVLGAVIAGDVAYNNIHQMLGMSSPTEWDAWIESLDAIERLQPTVVVAGHKKADAPDDAASVINGTRQYIRDFKALASQHDTVEDFVTAMRSTYPDHGNVTTLMFSANAYYKTRAEGNEEPSAAS